MANSIQSVHFMTLLREVRDYLRTKVSTWLACLVPQQRVTFLHMKDQLWVSVQKHNKPPYDLFWLLMHHAHINTANGEPVGVWGPMRFTETLLRIGLEKLSLAGEDAASIILLVCEIFFPCSLLVRLLDQLFSAAWC